MINWMLQGKGHRAAISDDMMKVTHTLKEKTTGVNKTLTESRTATRPALNTKEDSPEVAGYERELLVED